MTVLASDRAPSPSRVAAARSPAICLSMIVRNEARIIERCLDAVRPVVDAVCVCDTGSTDGTPDLVREWLARHRVPGRVERHAWRDFGHNRTLAIRAAQALLRELGIEAADAYLLFVDADMELRVEPEFRREELRADVYLLLQRNGSLVYPNIRLARASLDGRYVGATHEHYARPDDASEAQLLTLSIDDRNDGGSKGDKFARDARLLEEDLRRDPGNVRAMFYLGQTYRALGDVGRALFWYLRRIRAGGWPEEVWYAHYAIAQMHAEVGDARQAVRAFHAAMRLDPARAEPWFHLALLMRCRGRQQLATAYARHGASLPLPAERALFVERDVYTWGLLRELSIAAFYTDLAESGFEACETLALGREMPAHVAALAASNTAFYVQPLGGATYYPVRPATAPRFAPSSPSILPVDDGYVILCRTVSYRVDAYQRFVAKEDDGILRTRNVLMRVDGELRFQHQVEVSGGPAPLRQTWVQGFEDCRLIALGDRVAATCTTVDHHPSGFVAMSLIELDDEARVAHHVPLVGYRDDRHQKNWLPFVDDEGRLCAIYGYDPLVVLAIDRESGHCTPIVERPQGRHLGHWRGSAGPVTLPAELGGGRLLLVHEVAYHGRRYYFHRFVRVDDDWDIVAASRPFFFHDRGIEFVAGACLAHGGDELLVTFGVEEREAWLARLPLASVVAMLRPLP